MCCGGNLPAEGGGIKDGVSRVVLVSCVVEKEVLLSPLEFDVRERGGGGTCGDVFVSFEVEVVLRDVI